MPEIHALVVDQPAAQPGQQQPSIDELSRRLYETASPSIVKITTTLKDDRRAVGTGFAVKAPNVIATDYHCIAGAREIDVTLANGASYSHRKY